MIIVWIARESAAFRYSYDICPVKYGAQVRETISFLILSFFFQSNDKDFSAIRLCESPEFYLN